MPIIRAGAQLIYYAHVPKCGGSSVETYLENRFGPVAFVDTRHHQVPRERRWSRTSPQHIDRAVLDRLFPRGFFDAAFAVVRHPVARLVSAYHFQVEVEQSAPANMPFSDWLDMLPEAMEDDPYIYDNHTRPMTEIVPEGAQVFHIEHGIDAMIPWFDGITGRQDGPRALRRVNERKGKGQGRTAPSAADVARIADLYAADFDRFGYVPDRKAPTCEAPVLSPDFIAARDAELARQGSPVNWLKERLVRAMSL
ncbi:sulfotransferase family 2 domain-containing protein [Rhodobacterales bacterium HKCCE2091]|nr:sulfotransferase family 2 domain-containing protein [Rhodobacterales bacterium HKCCE2091]